MSKFRFTRQERMDKAREAATGWGSSRKMTPLGYAAWREGRMLAKKKQKEELLRKREEEARKRYAMKKEIETKRAGGKPGQPRRGMGKLLILLILIALAVYIYFRYFR